MKNAAFNGLLPSLSTFRSSARAVTDLALRRRSLNHRTIFAGVSIREERHRISGPIQNSMSEVNSEKIEEGKQKEATMPSEKKEKKLPTPPEQPDPGDCCGSGCVRCVWDVYYDELEDYNKLLNEISQSPPNSSAPPSKG